MFLGNIADRDKLDMFFTEQSCQPGIESDSNSAIGYWWQADELIAMASDCGWDAEVNRMSPEFYAAHYRFDVTLIRRTPVVA